MSFTKRRQTTLATIAIVCALVVAGGGVFVLIDGDQGGWIAIGASIGILLLLAAGSLLGRRYGSSR